MKSALVLFTIVLIENVASQANYTQRLIMQNLYIQQAWQTTMEEVDDTMRIMAEQNTILNRLEHQMNILPLVNTDSVNETIVNDICNNMDKILFETSFQVDPSKNAQLDCIQDYQGESKQLISDARSSYVKIIEHLDNTKKANCVSSKRALLCNRITAYKLHDLMRNDLESFYEDVKQSELAVTKSVNTAARCLLQAADDSKTNPQLLKCLQNFIINN